MSQLMLEQRSQEWLEFRKNKLGASDAPTILGENPWKSPYKLWREKLGLDENSFVNTAMQRGIDLEEEARNFLSRMLGVEFEPLCLQSDEYPWMIASLDCISKDRKIIAEIKIPSSPKEIKIPSFYKGQLQHQMKVGGYEENLYFNYCPDNIFTLVEYRDDHYIKNMVEKEAEFWELMQGLIPPFSRENDYVEIQDDAFCKAALQWQNLNRQLKELETKEKEMRNTLISFARGSNVKGAGIMLSKIVRKGNVDYNSIPELKEIDLESYRKAPIETWRLSEVK